MRFRIRLKRFLPKVMATPRRLGVGEDTVRAVGVITTGDTRLSHALFSNKKDVHSDKQNGGPWYIYGEEHDADVPDDTKNLGFAILLVNSAKAPPDGELLDDVHKLSHSVPVQMQSAGEHAAAGPVKQAVGTLSASIPVPTPIGRAAVDFGAKVVSDAIGSLLTNHDQVVFFDQVVIEDPSSVPVGENLEMTKTADTAERATYIVEWEVIKVA